MSILRISLILLAVILASGCATNQYDVEMMKVKLAYLEAQKQERKPMVSVTCPPTGCVFTSLDVYNGDDEPPIPVLPKDTTWKDVAINFGDNLTNILTNSNFSLMGLGMYAVRHAGDRITGSNNQHSSEDASVADSYNDQSQQDSSNHAQTDNSDHSIQSSESSSVADSNNSTQTTQTTTTTTSTVSENTETSSGNNNTTN